MLDFLLPPGFLDAEPPYWYAVIRAPAATARVLVFEPGGEGLEGGVFVTRYGPALDYLTETWYPTREAAIADVTEEFGDDLGPWTPVPESERDVERYLRATVAPTRG